MFEIDRITAIVRPKQAFLTWLQNYSEEYEEFALEDLANDCTALLIPVFDSPEEAEEYIEEIHQRIIENELELLDVDEDDWPEEITFDTFKEWFEIDYHSMVFDTAIEDSDLEDDDLEDDDDLDDDDDDEDDDEAYLDEGEEETERQLS